MLIHDMRLYKGIEHLFFQAFFQGCAFFIHFLAPHLIPFVFQFLFLPLHLIHTDIEVPLPETDLLIIHGHSRHLTAL